MVFRHVVFEAVAAHERLLTNLTLEQIIGMCQEMRLPISRIFQRHFFMTYLT